LKIRRFSRRVSEDAPLALVEHIARGASEHRNTDTMNEFTTAIC
jgi:hypothetical protein